MCSKLTIKTSETLFCSGNSEQISHINLVFLLLTLKPKVLGLRNATRGGDVNTFESPVRFQNMKLFSVSRVHNLMLHEKLKLK